MNHFPNPPFEFDPNDQALIEYVKGGGSPFCFLRRESRALVRKLSPARSLADQRHILLDLWSAVITDALRALKRKDRREFEEQDGIDFDSFFNKPSLGLEKLEAILKAYGEFEPLMYGAQPGRYRDHVAHAFRVWIMGQGLLEHCLGGTLVSDAPKKARIRSIEWRCMWAVAALCHDIGYPLTSLKDINRSTTEALHTQGLRQTGDLRFEFSSAAQPFHDTILRLMASRLVDMGDGADDPKSKAWATHLQNKYYLKFVNSFDEQQHGVLSALILGKSLVYFLESDFSHDTRGVMKAEDGRQFLIRREILRAIAAHTCPEIYHIRFNSLAFLLFIVDEMQLWGRPTFDQARAAGESNAQGTEPIVTVNGFGKRAVDVQVRTSGKRDDECKRINHKLSDIRRRIRLAVGSSELKDLRLRFAFTTSDDKEALLELADGKISQPDW